jgi:hypothetical protein
LIDKVNNYGNLDFKTWQTYNIKSLYSDIQNFPIFERLKNKLLDQSEDTRNAMYFLRSQVFSNSGPYSFNDNDMEFLKFFVNEGILRAENKDFVISYPLLHSFILKYIMPNIFRYCPLKKPPIHDDGSINVFKLLKEAINIFDQNYLKSAAILYNKTAQVLVDRKSDVLVPDENLYQQELAIIITNWLEKWNIISKNHISTNKDEKTSSLNYNLVITAPERPTAVIGIAATKTLSELDEYFNQTLTYAWSLEPELNVRDIWAIHFTCQDFYDKCLAWPTKKQEAAGLNIIHIWHDLKFTKVRISARWKGINGMREIINEKIE